MASIMENIDRFVIEKENLIEKQDADLIMLASEEVVQISLNAKDAATVEELNTIIDKGAEAIKSGEFSKLYEIPDGIKSEELKEKIDLIRDVIRVVVKYGMLINEFKLQFEQAEAEEQARKQAEAEEQARKQAEVEEQARKQAEVEEQARKQKEAESESLKKQVECAVKEVKALAKALIESKITNANRRIVANTELKVMLTIFEDELKELVSNQDLSFEKKTQLIDKIIDNARKQFKDKINKYVAAPVSKPAPVVKPTVTVSKPAPVSKSFKEWNSAYQTRVQETNKLFARGFFNMR